MSQRHRELISKLLETPPADQGGPTAHRGFHFQTSCAIDLIVKMHGAEPDYFILFDHHDDIVVVTANGSSFFQVKSTTKQRMRWSELIDLKGGKHSFLSRLYCNAIAFPDSIEQCVLISNRPFSVKMTENAKGEELVDQFTIINLPKSLRNEYHEHVHAANSASISAIGKSPWVADKTKCLKSELDLNTHEDLILGRVIHWLEGMGYHSAEDAKGFYRALRQEVLRRAALVVMPTTSAQAKSISKTEIQNLFVNLCKNGHIQVRDQVLPIIRDQFPASFLPRAKRILDDYAAVDLPNPAMDGLDEVNEWVRKILSEKSPALEGAGSLRAVVDLLSNNLPEPMRSALGDETRRMIILLYEVIRVQENT